MTQKYIKIYDLIPTAHTHTHTHTKILEQILGKRKPDASQSYWYKGPCDQPKVGTIAYVSSDYVVFPSLLLWAIFNISIYISTVMPHFHCVSHQMKSGRLD